MKTFEKLAPWISLVVSVLIAAVGFAFSAGMKAEAMNYTMKRSEATEARVGKIEEVIQAMAVDARETRTDVKWIKQSIEKTRNP